jgi:hypothetical protein
MTEPQQEQLDELEEDIQAARRHANEALGDDALEEPHFIDEGTVEEDKVDNTIVPPG